MATPEAEDLLRRLAPQVLGALVRRYGHFDTAEDATQEALIAAALQWPQDGLPANPRAWLIRVAARRLTDLLRSEQARQQREDTVAQWNMAEPQWQPAGQTATDADDSLIVLFMCCHPSLSPASQIALTLRAVGGLTTAEIARAFLVPEETMTRRISRAKQTIKGSGIPFRLPPDEERARHLGAVLHVLYLIFTEGYASTAGTRLYRVELSSEAIRLARMLQRLLPTESEVAGLLALMLLTDARRPARVGAQGELVPLGEQDRRLWNTEAIAEGVALITATLPKGPTGPYQLQAAIAVIHDEAPSEGATDWPQIVALYKLLLLMADNPVVTLNYAVAVAMARGAQAGLAILDTLQGDDRIANDHRLYAVRAHLLVKTGQHEAARAAYEDAARRATNPTQVRYLHDCAARLTTEN